MNQAKRKNPAKKRNGSEKTSVANMKKKSNMFSDGEKMKANVNKDKITVSNDLKSTSNATPFVPKKLERSNTFFITRKISKIYSSLTGSKTSLNKIPENENDTVPLPQTTTSDSRFKFVRSASLATIPLKNHHQPRILEQDEIVTLRKQIHPEQKLQKEPERKSSTSSFLSSLKRTFSVTSAKRKAHNERWSRSLLNLQQIDIMVSYENLAFIDYDKFNTYEEGLWKQKSIEHNAMQRNNYDRTSSLDPDAQRPRVVYRKGVDGSRRAFRQSMDETKLQMGYSTNRTSFPYDDRNSDDLAKLKRHSDYEKYTNMLPMDFVNSKWKINRVKRKNNSIPVNSGNLKPILRRTVSYNNLPQNTDAVDCGLISKTLNKSKSLPEIYNFSESMGTQPTNLPTEGRATPISSLRPVKLNQTFSADYSPEVSEAIQVQPSKQSRPRWTSLLGLKTPQQNQVCDILNDFSKNGVPQNGTSHFFDIPNLSPALHYLNNMPSSWKDFIACEDMTNNDIKVQSAIWELVTTEADYILVLQAIVELFLACLEAIQADNIMTDIDQKKLFSNIRDIYEANLKFWTLYLYPMVIDSTKSGRPMNIDFFHDGFIAFGAIFAPYKVYCSDQSVCQYYCKELNKNNNTFTLYLVWCESQKQCNRLRLADILVKPMQRFTKYNLLLTAIRKHILDESDIELMDSMIHSVEEFVFNVNSHLTMRQEYERLRGIMARIEAYEIMIKTLSNEHLDKMAKQYSHMFDLCAPMIGVTSDHPRHLFMEGDVKFKDRDGKIDTHCFLLTDILLVCKTISSKKGSLKIIRQPYMTDSLNVSFNDSTVHAVYINELNLLVTAFTLQSGESKNWYDGINKAKHIYKKLKQGCAWVNFGFKYQSNSDTLTVRKSPFNSSIGSRVSSLNNSHSGSFDLNETRISVDFEKGSSLSSEEGHASTSTHSPCKVPPKVLTSNTLLVQPVVNLGQSLPNLNLNATNVSTGNTLLVPGTSGDHNQAIFARGISYPPISPSRATLRRGFAFSASTKNPPLTKSRHVQSQSSFNTSLMSPIRAPTSSSSVTELPISSFDLEQLPSVRSQAYNKDDKKPTIGQWKSIESNV